MPSTIVEMSFPNPAWRVSVPSMKLAETGIDVGDDAAAAAAAVAAAVAVASSRFASDLASLISHIGSPSFFALLHQLLICSGLPLSRTSANWDLMACCLASKQVC
jgi:hypothetical protein